mmetsp:Transcript_19108/g.41643  ORF Transcript_19108/g.41643 Transcript_19108/m.41643 type:complete len:251 (+) Transcript_19108:1-753(+)
MRIPPVLTAAIAAVALPSVDAFASSPAVTNSNAPEAVKLVGEVDYDALAADPAAFPHSESTLIARAKTILNPEVLLGQKDDGECLSPDFEFVAAVVGPIGKEEYLGALSSFKLEESFDIKPNFFGFSVDPIMRNRVWFFNRQTGTHVAPFLGAEPKKADDKDAAKNELILPPQCYHIDFDDELKMKEFGFYTVDRRQGNTGGLGGAFGYMYGVGKPLPIPECQPYKRSFRFRLLNFVGGLAQKFAKKEKE